MRSSWLYLAMRSVRLAEPVLIWPARGADGEVGDRGVFGFARAVRDDRRVAGVARHRDRVERFGDRADLVQLDEQRVGDAVGDAALRESRDWSRRRRRRPAGRGRRAPPSAPSSPSQSPSARPSSMRDDRVLADPVVVQLDHLRRRAVRLAGLPEHVAGRRRPRARSPPRRARGRRPRRACSPPGRWPRGPDRALRGSTSGSARSRPRRRRRWSARASSGWRAAHGRSRRPPAAPPRTVGRPAGITMNSWRSTLLSACAPPFRMFIIGTGSEVPSLPPGYRPARCS